MEMDGSFLGMVGKNGGGQEGGERGRGGSGGFEDGDGISLSPEKLARTDASPFKMSAFSRCENGPTFYNGSGSEGRLDSVYDVPSGAVAASSAASTRTLQPFPVSLKSPGMASLRFPFTPAQWLELEQQALIFKHMVSAVPVPPDLLRPIRRSLADATSSSLAWGTGGVILRSANGVDPEPGRCRRTDGKKWRCSRDVAPDQKYCERHMHRGRPRSRKPVEVQLQRNSSINVPPSSTAHASTVLPRSLPLPSPLSSSSTSCPSSSHSPLTSPSFDLPPKHFQSSGLKVPTQTTMAAGLGNRSSRYLNWMGGASPHQWEPVQSDTQEHQQLRLSRNGDNTHILNYHDNLSLLPDSGCRSNGVQADSRNSLFGCNDLQGLQSTTECPPRQFIDAWSTEDRWFPTITATTPSNPSTVATTTSKSLASKLPLSPLSLSMSGGAASAGNEIDPIRMGMGLSVSDSDGGEAPKPHQGPIWKLPASWQSSSPLGGPLAEVLQSSSSTPMAPNSPKVSGGKSSPAGLNLRTDGWRDASPGGSPRLDSSPTGVLQKTLAAFSDSSSSSSSPTFGAKSEFALQWLSQQMPKLPSS